MVASLCLCCVQGEVKPALARLRESRAARARELSEEVLAVQERLDAGLEALTERTEDNAALGTQVTPLSISVLSFILDTFIMISLFLDSLCQCIL